MPKIEKILFEIPLFERFIETTKFATKTVCKHVDEVGVFIYYDAKTPELTTDLISDIPIRYSNRFYDSNIIWNRINILVGSRRIGT